MTVHVPASPNQADPPGFTIETEREENGCYLTEILELPGVMAYDATAREAVARVKGLALRVLTERLEHGEPAGEVAALFPAA